MHEMRAPIFIVGCGRSGTTLLYHMLLSAGGFAVYSAENNVFNLLGLRFGDLSVAKNRRKLMEVWLRSKLFKRSGLDREKIESAVANECRSSGDFIRIVMGEIAHQQHVDRWADTTAIHALHLPQIKKELPDALIVHMIRDGRDVALSFDKIGWTHPFPWDRKRSLLAAALWWQWIVRKCRKYGEALGCQYLEVRFEDLIDKPRETLATVSAFIGQDLDYDRIQRVAVGTVAKPNSSFKADSQREGFNPVGRWKGALSLQDVATVEELIGESLLELGYPLAAERRLRKRAFPVRLMQVIYPCLFETKLWLKTKTPLARLISIDRLEV